jgi:gamma-carbonic anhydrase
MILPYKGIYPTIDPTAFIEKSSHIVGDVHVGAESSVWFGAVIRGDVHWIRIGARSNIQDHCVLHVTHETHSLTIGDEVTVGHSVTLHGCVLRNRCLIGMGAVVMDGAEIGEESIVGAGALVTEGTKIPPRTLALGRPAKVVRDLRTKDIEELKISADNYVEYAKTYRAESDG